MIDYKREYRMMHNKHPLVFAGNSVLAHVDTIKGLIDEIRRPYDPVRMLDFGCGKGHQYSKEKINKRSWRIPQPFMYDIGVKAFRQPIPPKSFDCVICTDVMEHIDEPDIDGILTTIFGAIDPNPKLKTFIFFSIACRPARKTFDDGRNVHLTIKPPEWWQDHVSPFKIANGRVIVCCS